MASTTATRQAPAPAAIRKFVSRNYGALLSGALLVVLLLIYQGQSDQILSSFQVRILFNGALALVWAGIGLTIVVISGGFDLSIGSVMSLANVLAATFLAGEISDPLAVVAILAVGGLAGLLNGVLVAIAGIQSIIVTLAAMFIWFGVALLIMPQPGGVIPIYFSDLFGGRLGDIPIALIWVLAILVAIGIFRQTSAWNALFAIGGDEVSARRSGIKVTRARVLVYVIAGICYAMAGLSLSAQSTGGDANIGVPFLLVTFAAVILGGTPLGGGRGTLLGSVFGAFVVATLGSVLLSLSVTSYWTDVIQGTILILAVMVPLAAVSFSQRRGPIQNLWRR